MDYESFSRSMTSKTRFNVISNCFLPSIYVLFFSLPLTVERKIAIVYEIKSLILKATDERTAGWPMAVLNRTTDNAGGNFEKLGQGARRRKYATGKMHKFEWERNIFFFKKQDYIYEINVLY